MMTSNIDPKEQQKFAELASVWWDEAGSMKPLHQINPVRLAFILQHATLAQQSVLDIGCGGGILTESLASQQARVTAIDINEKLITVAREHSQKQGYPIEYRVCEPGALLTESRAFDVITCMELLEHVPDPVLLVQQCAKLLRPGGKVFFSTLNRNVKSFLGAIVAAEYILGWIPKGTHRYSQFIKPAELTAWANQMGLHLVSLRGMNYHPLSGTFQLSNDVSINYLACYELA